MEEMKWETKTAGDGQEPEETPEQAETMADYAKELEASFRTIKEGDIVTGTVISVNEEEVILDLQYYAQGVIRAQDMSDDPAFCLVDEIKPGDTVEAAVVKTDDGEGNILLSRKEAAQVLAWDILKKNMEEKTVLSVKISEAVKAGVVAWVEGIRGFIPASQLSTKYVENIGEEIRDYWYEVYIEGATRGVEDAVRIRVYRNDEYVTFAKARATGGAERDTTPFITDTLAGRVHIEDFWPESIDKYTLVVWIEGSDAECTDDILGGEFRVRMRFNSEYIEENQVS